jgi:hypothetical protein
MFTFAKGSTVPAATKTARPRKTTPAKKTRARPAAKKVAPAAEAKATGKPAKTRHKLMRDGFTVPSDDFALIGALKQRLLDAGRPTKKSELLRAGLHALSALSTARLVTTVDALLALKGGQTKKKD